MAGDWAQPRVSHLYEKADAAQVRPHGGIEMLPAPSPASPGSAQPANTDHISSGEYSASRHRPGILKLGRGYGIGQAGRKLGSKKELHLISEQH